MLHPKSTFARMAFFLVLSLLVAVPVHAQERDPWDLARRLLGFAAPYAIPDVTPLYRQGDTAEFWVTRANSTQRTKITAELAAASQNVYLWVEDGLSYQVQPMGAFAAQIDAMWTGLRRLSIYGRPTVLPGMSTPVRDLRSLLTIPDVDADPHLFILYTTDLGDDRIQFNLLDSLPAAIAPFSNQHEMIYINTSAVPDAPLHNNIFASLLSRGMYELLVDYHTPGQAQWLRETLSLFITSQLELTATSEEALPAFFQEPNTALTQAARIGTELPTQGVQQLWLRYLIQRFGVQFVQDVTLRPGEGLAAFDAAFMDATISDPVTRELLTGRDVFADFVMTNALNTVIKTPFGDGRYTHTLVPLPAEQLMAATLIEDEYNVQISGQSVNQFGTQYFYIINNKPASFKLTFTGNGTTPRLPMSGAVDNAFYWSGAGRNQSTTLTRAFDLTDVDSATLNFDAWFELVNQWNYGYIEVSADGGDTWAVVHTEASSTDNANGAAYGAGYTGTSNTAGPRPFPILGITIESDAITVNSIVPGGPASASDLQVGDKMIGYEGEEWPGIPNVVALLANNYAPGDTLTLLVDRAGERLDIPVVLGAHATRIVNPAPLWMPQTVDLSAYAGSHILVRFEYVSMPDDDNAGFAIDNIAVPEIDFSDDGGGEGWTLNGWQQVTNSVAQDFLVQVASVGVPDRSPSVRPLIGGADDATSGEWAFNTAAGEVLIVAVSGINADTIQPAQFALTLADAS